MKKNSTSPTSQKLYKEFLNENSPPYESIKWIMGGKRRTYFASIKEYGSCLKTHNPTAFEIGYHNWKRKVLGRI